MVPYEPELLNKFDDLGSVKPNFKTSSCSGRCGSVLELFHQGNARIEAESNIYRFHLVMLNARTCIHVFRLVTAYRHSLTSTSTTEKRLNKKLCRGLLCDHSAGSLIPPSLFVGYTLRFSLYAGCVTSPSQFPGLQQHTSVPTIVR